MRFPFYTIFLTQKSMQSSSAEEVYIADRRILLVVVAYRKSFVELPDRSG